jgi:DNA-binding winged helix-turn-helix (wHTH) protein
MIYRFASFEVDDSEFRLSQDGVPVVLEPKALRLLLFLVANPGRLIRKQELLDSVWFDAAVTENALTRSVALLRKMLNDDSREPRFIETVPTVGYRFLAPVQVLDAERAVGTTLEPASRAAFLTAARAEAQRSRLGRAALFVACGALLIGTVGWRLMATSRHAGAIRSDGMTGQLTTPGLRSPSFLL